MVSYQAGELDNDEKPIKVHSRKRYRIPAGKWRIGLPYMNKAGVIYMRFATKGNAIKELCKLNIAAVKVGYLKIQWNLEIIPL